MKNVLEFFIRAKDKTGQGTKQAQSNFKTMAKGILKNMVAIGAAFVGIRQGLKLFVSSIKEAIQLEAMKNPFIRFVGSAKEARQHLEDVRKIAKAGVFDFNEIANASRELMNLSDGLMGSAKDMTALADVATTTGEDIGSVAREVGRFYQMLRSGRDVSRAAMQLERLGIVSTGFIPKLIEMQKTGESTAEMWKVLQKEIHKFAGGIEDDAELIASKIKGTQEVIREAKTEFGKGFLSELDNSLGEKIGKQVGSGFWKQMGEGAGMFVSGVTDKISQVFNLLGATGETIGEVTAGGNVKNAITGAYKRHYGDDDGGTTLDLPGTKGALDGAITGLTEDELLKKSKAIVDQWNKMEVEEKENAITDLKEATEQWQKKQEKRLENEIKLLQDQKDQVQDLSYAEQDRYRKSIDALEKQKSLVKQLAVEYKRRFSDKDYDDQVRDAAKEEERLERKRELYLRRAYKKINTVAGTGRSLTRKEKLALEWVNAEKAGKDTEKNIKNAQERAAKAAEKTAEVLGEIKKRQDELLTLRD